MDLASIRVSVWTVRLMKDAAWKQLPQIPGSEKKSAREGDPPRGKALNPWWMVSISRAGQGRKNDFLSGQTERRQVQQEKVKIWHGRGRSGMRCGSITSRPHKWPAAPFISSNICPSLLHSHPLPNSSVNLSGLHSRTSFRSCLSLLICCRSPPPFHLILCLIFGKSFTAAPLCFVRVVGVCVFLPLACSRASFPVFPAAC